MYGVVVIGNVVAVNIFSFGNVDIDVSKIVGGDVGM